MKTEEAFGGVLKETRLEKGLSQAALANKCRCDVSSVSKLERGLTQPSLHFMLILAKGLDIPPEEFMRKIVAKRPDLTE